MNKKGIRNYFQEFRKLFISEKDTRVSPQDREHDALRENMRGQFQQLKKRGLSIHITVL